MYRLPQDAGDWTAGQILTYLKLCLHVSSECVGEAVSNIMNRECLPVNDTTDPVVELVRVWRRDSFSREELIDEALHIHRLINDLIF